MKCPKCGKTFSTPPAISRIDGKEICSLCGSREALEDAVKYGMVTLDNADEIQAEIERWEKER